MVVIASTNTRVGRSVSMVSMIRRVVGSRSTSFGRAAHASGKAHVRNNPSAVLLDRGHYAEAETFARQAMKVAREEEDLDLHAIATLNRAEALQALGRADQAESAASIALGHFEVSGNKWRRVMRSGWRSRRQE